MEDFTCNENIKEISSALAATDDSVLISEFLQSILTPSEVEEVASRWALVKLIDQGMSQRSIAKELGLSLCKITRGSRELKRDDSPFARMIKLVSSENKKKES